LRDSANPFFKSKYADLSSVVEAIREPLSANGLSYVQVVHDAESSAKVETLILHSSGEWLSCGAVSVPVAKADAQGFGSAMTYARRYSLSAAFGVAPEDDDGNAASKAAPKPGQIIDQNIALEKLSPEVRAALFKESKAIEADFYTISGKEALARWKKTSDMSEDERVCLWHMLDSKVRSGIKKYQEAEKAAA
jgi:hypothetical protein